MSGLGGREEFFMGGGARNGEGATEVFRILSE